MQRFSFFENLNSFISFGRYDENEGKNTIFPLHEYYFYSCIESIELA